MTGEEFNTRCNQTPFVLDGSSGTMMQSLGMPSGVCPELFVLEHPDWLRTLQWDYYEAGASLVYTFTFGGNEPKLGHFGITGENAAEINRKLASISCSIRDEYMRKFPGQTRWVAGDIAPTGAFLKPAGDMTTEAMKSIFRRQAQALLAGGVDLFVIETMMDLSEARLALMAVREICDLPVMVTMTFGKNGKTLAGNAVTECLLTLEDAKADAFGANCSTGPEEMIPLLAELRRITRLPLAAKPNAGMPIVENGRTIFPMTPEVFADACVKLIGDGVNLIGGCCGTTPDHIRELTGRLSNKLRGYPETGSIKPTETLFCSARRTVDLADDPQVVSMKVRQPYDPEGLEEQITEACEDRPDLLVMDFTGCESQPGFDPNQLTDAVESISMTEFTPLGVYGCSAMLAGMLKRVYCGKLAWLSDGEYNKLLIK
jgi:5-methyltetrahydrofolate--homocysteine methyltransferase